MKTTGIKTVQHLEAVLHCKISDIEDIVSEIGKHYREKREPKKDKRTGLPKPPKPDGTPQIRILYPTKEKSPLKKIQKSIVSQILSKIDLPKQVLGGVKHRDNIMNAKLHQGNKYKFATDLKDFFPSISEEMVFKMFLRNGFSTRIAKLLSRLTTFNNQVPQGAPTSTHIANLVFVKVDEHLIEFCQERGIRYTRFVDDLFFSSKTDFRNEARDIIQKIQRGRFKISFGKTFYTEGNAETTGVKIKNNGLSVTADFKWKKRNSVSRSPKSKIGSLDYEKRVLEYGKKKVKRVAAFLNS